MDTQKYLSYFFPFEKPDFFKNGKDSLWNINGDRTMIALAMTFRKEPEAQVMCFMRGYAERYDWLEQTFQDWSFTFLSSFLFYEEDEEMDEDTRDIYRQGMAAFGGIAPNYHIELWERPTIVWDFHSLLLAIQMMFSFMLADETSSLRLCKYCMKAFFAKSDEAVRLFPKYPAPQQRHSEHRDSVKAGLLQHPPPPRLRLSVCEASILRKRPSLFCPKHGPRSFFCFLSC